MGTFSGPGIDPAHCSGCAAAASWSPAAGAVARVPAAGTGHTTSGGQQPLPGARMARALILWHLFCTLLAHSGTLLTRCLQDDPPVVHGDAVPVDHAPAARHAAAVPLPEEVLHPRPRVAAQLVQVAHGGDPGHGSYSEDDSLLSLIRTSPRRRSCPRPAWPRRCTGAPARCLSRPAECTWSE